MSEFQPPDFLVLVHPFIIVFYYSEDLIGVENIFLTLNRSRMLIASKLTLFSCQNSSKSFHAARASCTNMRHLPTGSIRFHFMQGPCGSHKLIEVMLTKKEKRKGRKCQAERGHSKVDCDVALLVIKGAVFGYLPWNWTLLVLTWLWLPRKESAFNEKMLHLLANWFWEDRLTVGNLQGQTTLSDVFKYYFYLQAHQIRFITKVGRQSLLP